MRAPNHPSAPNRQPRPETCPQSQYPSRPIPDDIRLHRLIVTVDHLWSKMSDRPLNQLTPRERKRQADLAKTRRAKFTAFLAGLASHGGFWEDPWTKTPYQLDPSGPRESWQLLRGPILKRPNGRTTGMTLEQLTAARNRCREILDPDRTSADRPRPAA